MTTQPHGAPSRGSRVGDYVLLSKLGEGGMGIVHLARGTDGRRVALKVLRPHVVGDDEARARLGREVASLERVRSPWVAEFLDADPWAETPYVVTRYVPGLSLYAHVVEEGPVEDRDLLWLAGCLAEGIAAVHGADVLHRDIKPSNVLMEGRTPILIDFGLARVADDPRLTQTGWLLGTPGYLAPEILYGEDASPAADVHAWAATVVYAATGTPPFGRGPAMAIMDRARRGEHDLGELTGSIRDVLDAALAPDPLERPTLPEILAWIRPLSTRPDLPVAAAPVAGEVEDDFTLPLAIANGAAAPAAPPAAPPVPPPAASIPLAPAAAPAPIPATKVLPTEVVPPPPASAPAVPPPPPYPPPSPAPVPPPSQAPTIAQPPADGMARLERAWDDQWGEPVPPVKAPLGERLRRAAVVGSGALVVGGAFALAPYVAAIGVGLLVWLLRAGSLAASSVANKRLLRGRRWHDGVGLVVASPWHLVRAVTGTVVLVLWSAGIAAAAGLLCYAAAATVPTTLFVGGTALGVGLWTGVSSDRFRGPLSRLVDPAGRRLVPWLIVCVALLALAAGLTAGVASRGGTAWVPAGSGPFGL